MFQVRAKPLSEVIGGQVHSPNHAFDNVAVVAKQPARLSAIMAMVSAYLLPIKGARADSTSRSLMVHKGSNYVRGHSSAPLPLVSDALGVLFRISLNPKSVLLALGLVFSRLLPFFSTGNNIRLHVVSEPSFLGFRRLVRRPLPRSLPLQVLVSPLNLAGFVTLPLLGSAIYFSHVTRLA